MKYENDIFSKWIHNPSSYPPKFTKYDILEKNIDNEQFDEDNGGEQKLINEVIKQIYSSYVAYISLGVPPPFSFGESKSVNELINFPGDEFVVYRYDHPKYSLKKYLNTLSFSESHYQAVNERYKNLFLINKTICKLEADNSRAFEKFCHLILDEQGFQVALTQKSHEGGVDIDGYIKTYNRKNRQFVEIHPFVLQLVSIFNYKPLYSNLRILVQCKRAKFGKSITSDTIEIINGKFSGDNLYKILERLNKRIKREGSVENWEVAKILLTSVDVNDGARKKKNEYNLIVRNGIQLSWDTIFLSAKGSSSFDDYFDFDSGDFYEEAFLRNFNK